ncbi:MAG: polysaccharide deacetylase [Clostridiales bacterium]|uniref:polysaccharide deacetylase family protein n=1 Tax=Hornefia butyriciproducens TaxID=2652293 RepID=UPI0023F1F062|nr:polysaccharide deacetylase family protein [Hornefia butyriciproducens]MCI7326723.1 polysaccharide deacetylase [Clostridiales bacterium]MCI7679665.1 polysaccharide deacetylase [Clostridiales bacterium]MDD6299396.1 polysaccharide deacetylase [Hornefia butyriciproducens]MDD7020514.1 polysaccharide deacetylase [Hornefia butyriciproducens]MDY2991727.1 polysaccharide deacetylase family protein [Hornefia butyriciproducens]
MGEKKHNTVRKQRVLFFGIVLLIVILTGAVLGMIFLREGTLSLKTTSYSLEIGDTATLQTVFDKEKGRAVKVAYSTSNKTVAEVSENGTITAKRAGTCRIHCKTRGGQDVSAKVQVKAPEHTKTIYLTFEDGPDETVTGSILEILKKYDAKATFFVVGKNTEIQQDVIRREIAEGHTVGILCYEKDYNILYKSVDSYIKDFNKEEKLLKKISGKKPSYWRFPGGGNNDFLSASDEKEIMKRLHRRGYTEMDYNAMINDAVGVKYTSAEMTKYGIKTIDEAIKSFKVPVVELHDSASMKRTPAALEGILKYYKARGYSFKGLEDYRGPEMTFGKQK